MQVSNKPLYKGIFLKLFDLLYEVFDTNLSKQDFINFINELFSLKEQVMIIKRIAIFYLVTKGAGVNEIADKLKVSPGTSSKFALMASESKYISSFFNKKVKRERFINLLDDLYHDLLSPPTKYGTDWVAGWKIEIERNRKKEQLI